MVQPIRRGRSLSINIGNELVARISSGSGKFQAPITVPADVSIGDQPLFVDGVQCCTLHVLAHPFFKILSDSSNLSVSPGDSVSIAGWGFDITPTPRFELSGQFLKARSLAIDSLGRMRAELHVPLFPAGHYALRVAVGGQSWPSDRPLVIATHVWIEAEDLKIDTAFNGQAAPLNLCPWWNGRWSKQEVLDFEPDSTPAFLLAEFSIIQSGNYKLVVHGTQGQGFGNYQLIIDGTDTGILSGTTTIYPPVPAILDTIDVRLDSGLHRMRMNFLGANAAAPSGLIPSGTLWLDALELDPYQIPEAVSKTSSIPAHIIQDPSSESIRVVFEAPSRQPADLQLYDVMGREMNIVVSASPQVESFSTTMLPSGIYFLKVRNEVRKLLIMR